MKHKYILVPDVDCMNVQSIVYVVWVGDDSQSRSLYQQLDDYAARHGWWLERWAEHVDQRLAYYNSVVFHFDGYFLNRFRRVDGDIAEIISIVTGSDRDIFENHVSEPEGVHRFLCALYDVPKKCRNFSVNATLALCQKRKYLSQTKNPDSLAALFRYILIFALFALGAWLEHIEPYWY